MAKIVRGRHEFEISDEDLANLQALGLVAPAGPPDEFAILAGAEWDDIEVAMGFGKGRTLRAGPGPPIGR